MFVIAGSGGPRLHAQRQQPSGPAPRQASQPPEEPQQPHQRDERPSRALFEGRDPGPRSIGLTVSSFAAEDRSHSGDLVATGDPSSRHRYANVSVATAIRADTPRVTFTVDAAGTASRRVTLADTFTSASARASLTWAASSRTRVELQQSMQYASQYGLGAAGEPGTFQSISDADAVDIQLAGMDMLGFSARGSIVRKLAVATEAHLFADLQGDVPLGTAALGRARRGARAGGRIVHFWTRDIGLRIGYAHFRNHQASFSDTTQHQIEAGLQVERALTRSRRTRLLATSGSTIVSERDAAFGGGGARVVLTGRASIERDLGRTWTAGAGVERSVESVPGFDKPWIANRFFLSIDGLPSRRVDTTLTAAIQRGRVGFATGQRGYTNVDAASQIRIAVTRRWALYVQARLADVAFQRDVTAPSLFAGGLHRTSIRMGLSWWVPLRVSSMRGGRE